MSEATQAEPSPSAPRRRRPWLAAPMSLFWPGVGQLYNGEAGKALALFAISAALIGTTVVFTRAATPGPVAIVALFVMAALLVALAIFAAGDAFRQARRLRAVVLKRYQRVWLYALSAVAVLVFTNGVTRLSTWRPFSISSASMAPTVEPGEYVMTKRYARDEAPQRGDLAIFPFPRDRSIDYFKRIIGLPGDRVQLRGGVVYLNGAPLAREPLAGVFRSESVGNPAIQYVETMPDGRHYRIAKMKDSGWRNDTDEFVVPTDRYFVLGDNRDNSLDSRDREIGFVPRDDIIDRAYVIYWSADHSRITAALE
jgi:signal peptidase I